MNAAGIQSVTWTAATPTVGEFLLKLGDLYQRVSTYFPADAILLHPRRNDWRYAGTDSAGAQINPQFPAERFEVANMPVNLSSDQDAIIVLKRSETILLRGPVRFFAMSDVLSGTLAVRFQAIMHAALLIRQPGSVGKLTGSGLAAPVW